MELGELVHGREAAEMLGVARADDVWRAVKRHGDAYPGALTIYTFGRLKAARRCVRRYGGSRDSEYERNG